MIRFYEFLKRDCVFILNKIKIYLLRYYKWLDFRKSFDTFKKLDTKGRFELEWKSRYPCLDDNTFTTGFDRHYIYHPAWAARCVAKIKPKKHLDISSIINFSTLISAFVPVDFYDFRPANISLDNFESKSANILNLPFDNNSVESLSCMHVVEHIGLGRYGDELDPEGDVKAVAELKRVISKNGNLLFVVPVGKPRIQFNAHRVYSYEQVIDLFFDMELQEFSLISEHPNGGGLNSKANALDVSKQLYGCGCFWFKKRDCS